MKIFQEIFHKNINEYILIQILMNNHSYAEEYIDEE